MKLKKLWVPMLLLTLIGGVAKIGDTVCSIKGEAFFLTSTACNFIFIGTLVLMLILGFALSFADRKKVINVSPGKDILGGVFGFIASVAVIAGGVISFMSIESSTSLAMDTVSNLLTLFGGAILLFESCISFTGHNSMKKVPVLALAVPLWCCIRLISVFMEYTKVSIQCTEMFDLISVALLLMFLFYQSMIFAEINTSIAARKLVVYGMPFVISAIVVTADLIIKKTAADELTMSNILSYVGDIAFCGYAICLMKDVFKSAKMSNEKDDKTDTEGNLTDKSDITEPKSGTIKISQEVEPEAETIEVQQEIEPKAETIEVQQEIEPKVETVEVQQEIEPKAETIEVQQEIEPKAETIEVQQEIEPKAETVEVQQEIEPKVETVEVQQEIEPKAETVEVQQEIEPKAETVEVQQEIEPKAETVEVQQEIEPKAETVEVTQETEPKNSKSDYYDIFKLLDEMSSNK